MRKAIKIIICIFIFFLTLELTLQIASLIQNKILNEQLLTQRAKNNKQINILCVGDSFTQGVGASSRDYSYPLQLQSYLNANSPYNWKVFNCGVAGTNSSELVNFLPRILDYYSPAYLCVLIGMNDSWNYNLVEKSMSNQTTNFVNNGRNLIPWRLCFRTLKFFKMLLKYFKEIKIVKNCLPNKNTVKNSFNSGYEKNKDSEDVQALFEYGIKLLSENRPQEASEIFTKIISIAPDHLGAQIQLAYSLVAQKRSDEALSRAHLIRKTILDKPLIQHIHLAWFFMYIGEFQYAYNEINQYKKYFPGDLGLIYETLGNIAFETFDYGTAESYFKKVIKNYPQRTFSYRTLARIYSLKDNKLEEALKLLIQAYLVDKNATQTKLYLSIVHSSSPFTLERFMEILDKFKGELEIDLNSYNELRILCQTMIKRIGGEDILKKNLSTISALCLQRKVVPVFVTYPGPMHSSITQVIRDFCRQRNEFMIDAEKIFGSLLAENKFEKYFVADYHLNDEGYKILGERIGFFFIDKISSKTKEK